MKNIRSTITFILALSTAACGQKTEVYCTSDGAIGGYDPVAFFKEAKPVKGKADLKYEWHGVTWSFASAENMEQFKSSPEKYAPQYGGYCAWGTADGHLSPTVPETWTIVNDKLYFNYSMSVKERWMKDQSGNIVKADANWPGLKKN